LLVRIFDACGFETELARHPGGTFWDEDANAGLESLPLAGDDQPYVVKSPWSYQFIEEMLNCPDIQLDAVLVPIRNLADAAASRIVLELQHRYRRGSPDSFLEHPWKDWGAVPGGVVHSLEPLDQARILAHSLYTLIEPLARREVPIKFLSFPRFVSDPEYLYRALGEIVQSKLTQAEFCRCVETVVNRKLVRIGSAEKILLGELSETPPPSPCEATVLPDFETLDRTALRREVQRLNSKLLEVSEKCKKLEVRCQRLDAKARRRTIAGRFCQARDYLLGNLPTRRVLRTA
jgi:hypothetical protein